MTLLRLKGLAALLTVRPAGWMSAVYVRAGLARVCRGLKSGPLVKQSANKVESALAVPDSPQVSLSRFLVELWHNWTGGSS
jgi:hypothetical protein